jgi:beta-mannosidase
VAKTTLDLSGNWQFKEYPLSVRRMRDLDTADWQPARVPSSVFTSLIESGQIDRTDINTHPERFAWVSEKPWVYRKTFDAPAELLDCDRTDLVFDGLDTVAGIWLNDKLIARTANMFVALRFDVTGLLRPDNNSLLVKFEPATEYAAGLMNRYGCLDDTGFSNPARAYARKAQYQFGWDFCPPLPGCGIWRPLHLEGINKARIADLHVRTVDCNHSFADVKVAVTIDRLATEKLTCNLSLSGHGRDIRQDLTFNADQSFHSTLIRLENPALWCPSGYGSQPLYQLSARLLSPDQLIDQKDQNVGMRTVRLNRSTEAHARKFEFEVNGQNIFARGANWVPPSIFPGSVTRDDYEQLLLAAKQANMNMLRVWGGGYYETDEFYELCDRLGILVWQDFMFACAYYPDRTWFLHEVEAEAAATIKRLRNHPSLVLWCGNNEIDWLHATGRLGKGRKFYGRPIYHNLLPRLVAEFDPDTAYIPTTPLGRAEDFKTASTLTTHQWQVWSDNQPVANYLSSPPDIPAFVTEFGLQSLPNLETIKTFCPSDHMRVGGRILEKHNYQLDGNSRLYRYLGDLFGTAETLEQFVYLSQITQARAVKAYVEHLRAHNSKNAGVLFWQLNDSCPAISWSACDYAKEPKALYYYARRFYSDLLVAAVPEAYTSRAGLPPRFQSIHVVAVNDRNQPLTATLNCRLIDLFGRVIDTVVFPVAVGPFSSSALLKLPKAFIFPADPDKSALHLTLDREGRKVAENLFLYLPDKYVDWPDAKIAVDISRAAERRWELRLKSDALAKDARVRFCGLGAHAQISDNFIDLIPQQEFVITVDCDKTRRAIETALELSSIRLPPA